MSHSISEHQREALKTLQSLRAFSGPPVDFWRSYIKYLTKLCAAEQGYLLTYNQKAWHRLNCWPAETPNMDPAFFQQRAIPLVQHALDHGHALEKHTHDNQLITIRLNLPEDHPPTIVLLIHNAPSQTDPLLFQLCAFSDLAQSFQQERQLIQARHDVRRMANAVDTSLLLNESRKFIQAAMTLCNEIATRFHCDQTALGWLEGRYIRLKAMSGMERFNAKMASVQALEAAMEEAFDQDEEILYPAPPKQDAITRDHQRFIKQHGLDYMITLPIRLNNQAVGVLSCERRKRDFTTEELNDLRLVCDQTARRLVDLKWYDRWLGARLFSLIKEHLGRVIGVDQTLGKLITLTVATVFGFILFGTWPYHVEGSLTLKTDDLIFMPAPFDGYIDQVHVKIGDQVEKDKLLLTLDTQDLLLEEASHAADVSRFQHEAEKNRVAGALADMKIARAMEKQSFVRLQKVRYHLGNAKVYAPFDGIIIEGELEKMLGAPVRKGDILFKIGTLGKMYAEIDIDERDIHEIKTQATGRASLVSRPHLTFSLVVNQITPVSTT
ncbi:efflux RND transporter periplasmic adaptor subunit, partial [Magnetococcales bacterium HHB-1]